MAPLSVSLPTFDKTGGQLDPNVDAQAVVSEWFSAFTQALEKVNIDATAALFVEDSAWRDILALTWDFRSIYGIDGIKKLLGSRLEVTKLSSLKLQGDALLQPMLPNFAFIQSFFTFETGVGIGTGVFRLVPVAKGGWQAHTIYTSLDDLKGFPEKLGPLREQAMYQGNWDDKRKHDAEFLDGDPKVVVIGAGQSGLEIGARLKQLDVPTLIVEREKRVGDGWRKRYDSLCLHDPVYYDHMPYIPFPPSWPVYTPAHKLATWLESYATSLELNVWTSTGVDGATYDASARQWTVKITRGDGSHRVLKPNHLVFALGFGGDAPIIPEIPGKSDFKGTVLHSSAYKTAKDFQGKKALVVGAGNSGHDIAADFCKLGMDVTMVQRSSTHVVSAVEGVGIYLGALYGENAPPLEVADKVNASFPYAVLKQIHKVVSPLTVPKKEIMDGLKKAGFETNVGEEGSGFMYLYLRRGGGYYLDTGASQMIADGKIKIKHGVEIAKLDATEVIFTDGTKTPADVVVLCTGYGDPRDVVRKVVGNTIADKLRPVWGLDEEDEIRSVWRDSGHERLWFMMGNLAMARGYSKSLALQIKAIEEDIFGTRYSLQD